MKNNNEHGSVLRMRKHAKRQTDISNGGAGGGSTRTAISGAEGSGGGVSITGITPSGGAGGAGSTSAPDDDTSSEQTTTRSTPSVQSESTSTTPFTTSTTSQQETSSSAVESTTSTSSSSSTPSTTSTTAASTTSSEEVLSTTTVLSTSTSSRLPSTSSTTSDEETTSAASTSSATRNLVTSLVTASASLSSVSRAISSSASGVTNSDNSGSSSDGPSAGTVVGIVAGALVGVVVLSGIVGYFFRTKCTNSKDDEYDGENPFGTPQDAWNSSSGTRAQSRSELRRDSQMLSGDDDASIHQMSELGHGMGPGSLSSPGMAGFGAGPNAAPVMAGAAAGGAAAAGYGLARNGTQNSNSRIAGLARSDTYNPRPPTMIQRRFAQENQGPMPSFQPGQLVQPGQFYPNAGQASSGPYPAFPPANASGPVGMAYGGPAPLAAQQGRSLTSPVNEYENLANEVPARSGTPEFNNPQQYFHQAHDSYSSGQFNPSFASPNVSHNEIVMLNDHSNPGHNAFASPFDSQPELAGQAQAREGGMPAEQRAKRTLSVRNGGLDGGVRDSVYGGM